MSVPFYRCSNIHMFVSDVGQFIHEIPCFPLIKTEHFKCINTFSYHIPLCNCTQDKGHTCYNSLLFNRSKRIKIQYIS